MGGTEPGRTEFEPVAQGEGWREERPDCTSSSSSRRAGTGSPAASRTTPDGTVNVLNLVEGDEAVVESPSADFEPFVVHYAETFIVPASVGALPHPSARPRAETPLATVKAYVREP